MKHMLTHLRPSFSFRESRLCFQNTPGGNLDLPPPSPSEQQNQKKVNNAGEKMNVEQQGRFKELRVKLAKLEMEVKRANAIKDSKEKVAHMKEQQEAIRVLLRSVEPSLIQEFARETRVPDLVSRLEGMLYSDAGEQARKRLIEGLAALNSGTSFQQYATEEGIMKVARNIVGSGLARNILEGLRERGFAVQTETVVNFLFGVVRGFAANAFATSKWFNAMPELRERGRQYHYRIALEAHLRAEAARNNGTPPNFADMFSQSTADLETLAVPANRENCRRDWNTLYDAWRTVAQGRRQNNMSAAIPPVPTIEQAADMAGAGQKYLASINQAPQQQNNPPPESPRPRPIDALIFNPPNFELPVTEAQTLTVAVNGTRMQFRKDGGNLQMRAGSDDSAPFRTFYDANNTTRAASLTLVAASANAGDIEIRANGRNQGVRLSVLQQQVTATANQNMNRITFTNPTTLSFSA